MRPQTVLCRSRCRYDGFCVDCGGSSSFLISSVVLAKPDLIDMLRVACYRLFAVRAGVCCTHCLPLKLVPEPCGAPGGGLGAAAPDRRAPAFCEAAKAVN